MAYVILRLLYGLYFFGIAAILFNAVGRLLFGSPAFKRRASSFWRAVFVSPLWPLMVPTQKGRKKLLGIMNPELPK